MGAQRLNGKPSFCSYIWQENVANFREDSVFLFFFWWSSAIFGRKMQQISREDFIGLHLHFARKCSKNTKSAGAQRYVNPALKKIIRTALRIFNFGPPTARMHAVFANKRLRFDHTKED